MFDFLRKKLSKSVERLTEKLSKPERPRIEEKIKKPEKVEKLERAGLKKRIKERFLERKVSEKDIDDFFSEIELDLMEANVALEVVDFLEERMKEYLVGKQLKRGEIEKKIRQTLEKILVEIFDQGRIDVKSMIREKKPLCFVFLGFNGSGKTTSIAKFGRYLMDKHYSIVLAAGDTFRAASIEQLEVHGEKLGVKVIKHKYGADSAAVVYDAIEHAKSRGLDFVLADTAGRSHKDQNLMDELKKVVRVNNPDLKILVVDSLTGNDVIEQAKQFDQAVGVDCMIFTKVDVNKKGGSLLSACYAIKKPILFIGTGQEYRDLEMFEPKRFVKDLME
jgi:fused signal recognition particle receptor